MSEKTALERAYDHGRTAGKLEQDSKLYQDGYRHGRRETAREALKAVEPINCQCGCGLALIEALGLEDGDG